MILVDTHSDDSIFKPLSFKFSNRRPLQKYNYLSKVSSKIFITNRVTSLPKKINNVLPSFVLKLLIYFEVKLWKFFNKNSEIELINKIETKDVFFLFAKKNIQSINYLVKNYPENKIYVHISHYHLFHKELNLILLNSKNIILCYDFDVAGHPYFKRNLYNYSSNIKVVPFQVNSRFFNRVKRVESKNKIGIIGTYHEYDLDESSLDLLSFDGKFKTLHPLRHALSKLNFSEAKWVVNKLSLYNKKNIFSNFIKISGFSAQKEYFSFDMVDFFDSVSFIVCASEGSGAIGIGLIEAMARKKGVIISKIDADLLKIKADDGIVIYNNFDDLRNILFSYPKFTNYEFNENLKIAQKYKMENLIIDAKKNLI